MISIINYRTAAMTIECVRSVLAVLGDVDGHVVVVDNDSGDDSRGILQEWIHADRLEGRVTLILSPTNGGFSAGHNIGISAHSGEYYLVLNSDAVLRSGFFDTLLSVADSNPHQGLFAPRLEYETGEGQISCFRFPSPASELIRGANTGPVTRLLKRYDVPLDLSPDPEQIEWASFACILLRGEMVRQIGLMDDGYFLYFEDTEYCLRAKRAGWGIAYVPEARAVHFRGGSAPVKALAAARKRLPTYHYASRTRLFYQTYGRWGLSIANLAWFTGRGIARLRGLLGRPTAPPNSREARDIWTNFFDPLGSSHAPKTQDFA